MDFKEYQDRARRTQNKELCQGEKEMHALHGIASEAGEIHGIYQKEYQGHALDKAKIADEMGDLLWFLAELSDAIQIPLDVIAVHNIAKLRDRYPEGFDADHSIHRKEYM